MVVTPCLGHRARNAQAVRERLQLQPAVVDVLAHGVMKDGAVSDMFGNMQSPVIHIEEQL